MIIWLVFLALIFFVVSNLNSAWKKSPNSKTPSDFSIWIVWDSRDNFSLFLEWFKASYPEYKSSNITVESFSSYEDYQTSLSRGFLADKAPDIFVVNNNETSIFENQILWINPNIIDPNNFRKNYEAVFSNDLISSVSTNDASWEAKKTEFLKWVPLWYETMWVFYDMRVLRAKDLSTWASVNDAINYIKTSKWENLPIALWDGKSIKDSSDIMTNFFMQEWAKSIDDVKDNLSKWSFARYFMYWDKSWENWYMLKFDDSNNLNKTAIQLFSEWQVSMLIWYPRLINDIDSTWFKKSFLRASFLPQMTNQNQLSLVNYNYFVVNKNTKKEDLAMSIMTYFSSEKWQKDYHKAFPYYTPAMPNVARSVEDDDIKDWYSIKIKDFQNANSELSSFNKKLKVVYDKELSNILDNPLNYSFLFDNFTKNISCKYDKFINFANFSQVCE